MNPGPPVLYQLNTERKYIDETEKKVRQFTYGRKDRNKQNKVILLVGETGAGKTTIINTITNFLLGIKFEDEVWYQITEDKEEHNQTQSQTSAVNVYELFVEENPTSLTIIDTPGYGHNEGYEKDREIAEYLSRLFSDNSVIGIDAVCFVMKASQNFLSGIEHYIFHSVLSLFGRDLENNIMVIITHSDGLPPTNVLKAINTAELPCRRDGRKQPVYFLFNNRQKEKRDEQYVQMYRSTWEMGERNMNLLLTQLEEKNRKSLQMTLDVLNLRKKLEVCVSNLKKKIFEKKKLETEDVTRIQEDIKQNSKKIEKYENFQFTVRKVFKEKVLIENVTWWNKNATCCSVCEENCHEWGCWWVNDLSWCSVMKNNYCTVCTGKCHYSKHIQENKKYVMKTKKVEMTFDALKQEYKCTGDQPATEFDKKIYENIKKEHESTLRELENKLKEKEKLNSDLEKIKKQQFILLHETYLCIISLHNIALKPDSASTLQYLDFLIPRLKEEGQDEWMKNLEDLKKTGQEMRNKGALNCLVNRGEQHD